MRDVARGFGRWLTGAVWLLTAACGAFAQNTTTVAWQNSAAPEKLLRDTDGTTLLTAGTAAPSDGTVLQLGYYTGGTPGSPFAGSFVPLTGEGTLNTAFATTSVGDAPGDQAGRFTIVSAFEAGSTTTGLSLPLSGTPVVIRFFNATTIAAATHFNEVSSPAVNWRWLSPSQPPGELLLLSLSDPALAWRGVPYRTSLAVGSIPNSTYLLVPDDAAFTAAGGSGTFSVNVSDTTGPWAAVTSDDWITIQAPFVGNGSGVVHYTVAANSSQTPREGVISCAGQVFQIRQAGEINSTLRQARTFAVFGKRGGNGAVDIIANDADAAWTAVSNDTWMTLTSAASGVGPARVTFSVTALDAATPARTGTLTVAGQTFTVLQSAIALKSTLTVTATGPGAVAGTLPALRTVGAAYALTAKPGPGAVFAGWTGTNVDFAPGAQDNATLRFVMGQGTTLTASFIASPFVANPATGSYTGFVTGPDPSDPKQAGLISVKVTATGKFTGALTLGGIRYSLSGTFTGNGDADVLITRSKLPPLFVSLTLDFPTKSLAATITEQAADGILIATATAEPAYVAPPDSAAMGAYTSVLEVQTSANFGSGFGSMKLSKNGAGRFVGRLPDGAAVSVPVQVDANNRWHFYASIYSKGGFIGGTINVRDITEVSDMDGGLRWRKPTVAANTRDPLYRAGFDQTLTLLASRFAAPPKGTRILNVANAANNLNCILDGGNLAIAPAQRPVTLETTNKFTIVPDAAKLTLTANTTSGLLGGKFIHDSTGKTTSILGVFYQKQDMALGLFIGVDRTGAITLHAP